MKKLIEIISACAMAVLISCSSDVTGPQELIVYYNSFEYPQDTLEWEGISYLMFVDDPAPDGGNKSLLIGGGCSQPAAKIYFEGPAEETNYKLGFWAKMKDSTQSAQVLLTRSEGEDWPSEDLVQTVSGTEWQVYYTDSLFYCPAKGKFELHIYAGGIVPAEMYIDKLGLVYIE